MVDLDNSGWPDLAIVTGNVYPSIERRLPAYPYRTPHLVFRNLGNGLFEWLPDTAGPGLRARHSRRGCAFGDFDNDGDVDIAVVNLHEPPVAAAQRPVEQPQLDQGAARRGTLKPQCRRCDGHRPARGAGSGTGRHKPSELLLCERQETPFRAS